MPKPAVIRFGTGEGGEKLRRPGIHEIGGGYDGDEREAALRCREELPGVGSDSRQLQRRGFRVGEGRVRRGVKGGVGAIPGVASFYIPFRNGKREDGIVVPFCLPAVAMEIFVKELNELLKEKAEEEEQPIIPAKKPSTFILSAL